MKYLHEQKRDDRLFEHEEERLTNMKILLKRVLENTQVFDTR